MRKIIQLSPEISKKIAAGEVVERAFSVVKELVENSLDAEATDIKVELLEGGKKLIRVKDNGCGMKKEDALLCFERHSTSKISQEEDLDRISTLGFRGEALPSISSVSGVILKTSQGEKEKGTQVERRGEELVGVSDIAYPKGTCVEVRDLFYNIPARRKFLRTNRAELSQTVKYLTTVALAYPGVGFSLRHGRRQVFNYPPVRSTMERIYQIYGKSILENLIEINYKENKKRLYGFISLPPRGRRDRSQQLIFINKRPVKDRVLQAAVNQAYQRFLEKDYFAQVFLFLFLSPSEVDVNVHPAKAEVRFKHSRSIFQFVYRCIEQAILKEMGMKEVYVSGEERQRGKEVREGGQPSVFKSGEREGERRVYREWRGEKEGKEESELFPYSTKEVEVYPRVLGQFLNFYIVTSNEEGLIVIDQHNAHERVLYEKYKQIDRDKQWPRKLSLLPAILEFTPSQQVSYPDNKELLEEIGFRVEPMGGNSYALKEFPDFFNVQEAKEIFLSLLEEVKEEKVEHKREKILATLACKTAVKAGEELPLKKMNYLVEELFKTSNPSLCPHGRPVMVKISRREIEKGLKRGGKDS